MPWIQARFLECDTAHLEISQVKARQEGVWIFTDGSVQANLSAATTIIFDAYGPLNGIFLWFLLEPL